MKFNLRAALILSACVTACFAFSAADAKADGCGSNGYCGDGFYYGFYRRQVMSDQLPPYFSQFPPVYYAGPPIPRTYGWSPFALRPTEYDAIPRHAVKPAMINNPYVPEAGKDQAEKKTTSDKTARVSPKMILNPYVQANTPAYVAKHSLQR
ncbi:MAG: hypothetical protein WBF93_09040 [Pirellulales bacterium]|nr:hypothetical protein [Pirellulales bacterium]